MKDLLLVKNISREGPGLLQYLIDEHGLSYDLIDLDKGDALPILDDYRAIVVFGGPDSANDENQKMIDELEMVKKVIDKKMPYLGICLGMQVLARAAGADVIESEIKEVGFFDADQNPFVVNKVDDDLIFNRLGNSYRVFHLHGETIKPNRKINVIGEGELVKNQIIKIGDNQYGIQSHFELTQDMLEEWADNDPDLQPIGKDILLKQFLDFEDQYTEVGLKLFENFLKSARLIK